MTTDITKESTEVIDTEWLMSAMAMSVVMVAVVLAMVPSVIESARRVPVLSEAPEPSASNEGYLFILARPGQSSELRIIAENDTGAFESVLVSLTT